MCWFGDDLCKPVMMILELNGVRKNCNCVIGKWMTGIKKKAVRVTYAFYPTRAGKRESKKTRQGAG